MRVNCPIQGRLNKTMVSMSFSKVLAHHPPALTGLGGLTEETNPSSLTFGAIW